MICAWSSGQLRARPSSASGQAKASSRASPRIGEPGNIERNLNPLLRMAVYCVQYINFERYYGVQEASTQKLNATTAGFCSVLAKQILTDPK
jgi:hypothetical protein